MPSDGVDPLPRGSASTDRAVRSWAHPAGFRGVELRFPWKPQFDSMHPCAPMARSAQFAAVAEDLVRDRTGVLHQPASAERTAPCCTHGIAQGSAQMLAEPGEYAQPGVCCSRRII